MLLKLGKILHGMQKEEKKKKGEEGFTLIELLVVVIIIGILAAIAIPTFLGQRARAQDAQAQSSARNALTTGKSVWTQTQTYDGTNGVTIARLNAAEPSLTFAAAPTAAGANANPNTVGYVATDANIATFGTCSRSGACWWARTNEGAATTGAGAVPSGTQFGSSSGAGTAPTNWQTGSFPAAP